LKSITENLVHLSHGMDQEKFLQLLMQKSNCTPDTEMALYFYKKEPPSA